MRNITNALNAPGESLLWNKLHRVKYLLGLMLCVTGISLTVIAAVPSDLDSTFGNGGKVVSSPDGSQMTAGYGMALQPDGKIVMVGSRMQASPVAPAGFIVVRYNPDGSLDTTFGNNGWSSAIFGVTSEFASVVDIQPDGKIVVGGTIQNIVNNVLFTDVAVVRFNPNGSLDTTFDGDGKVTFGFNDMLAGFYNEFVSSLKIASDGKIVVGGYFKDGSVDARFILARISPDGSLDTTFGTNGKLLNARIGLNDMLKDLVVLPDGKIVVAGYSNGGEATTRIVVKYKINGDVEWTYAQTLIGFGPLQALNGIAALPDGKFIVVGQRSAKILAIRLNADGTEDSSFNNATITPNGEAFSVAIQPDGKIVANISSNTVGFSTFSLVRYNANGSLDSGFGNGGTVNTSVYNGQEIGRKVIIQPDGKILVGGSSKVSLPAFFVMVRYLGDAAVPYNPLFDYNGDGKADLSVFRPSTGFWYIARPTGTPSQNFDAVQFGVNEDLLAPADFDGDGKTDICVFRPSAGSWYRLNSSNNTFSAFQFGTNGDFPAPGDFDGDSKADLTVYRPSAGSWYRINSSNNQFIAAQFGAAEDKPLVGDFDGDRKSDLAVYRPSNGTWYRINSATDTFAANQFGAPNDKPVAADYDGDGKTDLAVYRPAAGDWYIVNSSNVSFSATHFGVPEDKPAPADFDGDGKTDLAVFRPSSGSWYLLRTTDGFTGIQFGANGDIPTPNAFVR